MFLKTQCCSNWGGSEIVVGKVFADKSLLVGKVFALSVSGNIKTMTTKPFFHPGKIGSYKNCMAQEQFLTIPLHFFSHYSLVLQSGSRIPSCLVRSVSLSIQAQLAPELFLVDEQLLLGAVNKFLCGRFSPWHQPGCV